jgi:hypothetical protein
MSPSQDTFRMTLPTELQATLDGIFARNRARFGHDAFRMEGDGGDSGGAGDGGGDGDTGDQGDDAGAGDDSKKTGDDAKDAGAPEGKVEDLPDWAQRIIRDTRADAGKARNDAKKQAADEARQELAQNIGKAIGLIKDDDKTKVDPTELARQLTDARGETRETKAELVVWRNQSDLKVDAKALTDSKAFSNAIKDFDPSSETFEADVKKAAQAALKQNPKLAAVQAAGSSSADHGAGGSGEGTKRTPKSLTDAVGGHYGT